VGRELRYRYDIHDNSLILSVIDATGPFEGQDSSDRYVYIGINLDSSDEDDDEDDSNFSLYASCFVRELTSSLIFFKDERPIPPGRETLNIEHRM
jgi:hypothetical protein